MLRVHYGGSGLVGRAESAGVRLAEVEDDAFEAALVASSDPVAAGLAGDAKVAEELRRAKTQSALTRYGSMPGALEST